MRAEHLKSFEGKVVTLDLINGMQVTTRLVQIDETYNEAVCEMLLLYQITGVKQIEGKPALVGEPVPYGKPMFESPKTVRLHLDHIMLRFDTPKQLEAIYVQQTSHILPVGAGALERLDDMMKRFQPKQV